MGSLTTVPCPSCTEPWKPGDANFCGVCRGYGSVEVCGNCGMSSRGWVRRNVSEVGLEYDWYCATCNEFVRIGNT